MEQIGVGIVGLGFGLSVHAPAWSSIPGVRVVAISGRDPVRTAKAATSLGIEPLSVEEQLSSPAIQVVSIAVPPHDQEDLIIRAARAGKHIFCEKPLGASLAGSRKVSQVVSESGVSLGIDLIFPELPLWQKAKSAIPVIGKISHAHLSWRLESRAFRASETSWKVLANAGGGTLYNFGAHTFYYLEWLFGPIAKLVATRGDSRDVDPHVEILLRFASGMSASVTLAADAYNGTGHRLEVYGENGSYTLANNSGDFARGFALDLALRGEKQIIRTVDEQVGAGDGRIHPVSCLMDRFLKTIRIGAQMTPALNEALRIQELLDAADRSIESGHWVNI